MVPAYFQTLNTYLLEHFVHFESVDVVGWFDGDGGADLWHWEDVRHMDRVIIDYLAEHEAHYFEGDT